MTVALVLVPMLVALCVGGYFLVGKYERFLRRNKTNKRKCSRKKNNDK